MVPGRNRGGGLWHVVLVPVLMNLSLVLVMVLGGPRSVGVGGLIVILVVVVVVAVVLLVLKFKSVAVMGGFDTTKLGLRFGSKTSAVFSEGDSKLPDK